jgi:hypothetical protein
MIRGYGEDALTLWALKNQLHQITNGRCTPSTIYYRPSFGRGQSGLGEFDFIILGKGYIILGESKWGNSPEVQKNGQIRDVQKNRHYEMTRIIQGISSKSFPVDSILKNHIDELEKRIEKECGKSPEIVNVLLIISKEEFKGEIPESFELIQIEPPTTSDGDYVPL